MSEDLRALHRHVLLLVAELAYTGPSLSLKVELARRKQALEEFWATWLAGPWVGYPTEEKLSELEFHLREPLWLARFSTVEAAVRHLRQAIRGRSKPIEDLPLLDQLVAAPSFDVVEELELLDQVETLDGPAKVFLAERLAEETWEGAAVAAGMPTSKACGFRKSLQKKFSHLSAYRALDPKRRRAR